MKKKSSKYKLLTHKARGASKSTYLATNSLPTAMYTIITATFTTIYTVLNYRKSDVNYNGVYKVPFN